MQGVIKFTVKKRATGTRVASSNDVFGYLRDMADLSQETLVVLLLTAKNAVLGREIVAMGSLTAAIVSPAQVFVPALLAGAAAIVIAHNHPSGDATPSAEDRDLTAKIVAAGKILNIRVLDHLVIGDDRYFSFADQSQM